MYFALARARPRLEVPGAQWLAFEGGDGVFGFGDEFLVGGQ